MRAVRIFATLLNSAAHSAASEIDTAYPYAIGIGIGPVYYHHRH